MEYHNILKKQVKKLLPNHYLADETIQQFLESISNSYGTFERANQIAEHAFTISEKEYQEINKFLLIENEIKHQSISEVKKAIKSLSPETSLSLDSSNNDLIHIIQFLQEQINKAKELETQLILSKEIAEKAALTKAQFLSTMSHEIRTPMNAVIGFTHLLLQLDPRPEQSEYLKLLKFSAENLLVLINDILDFSKIEAGKVEFEEADFLIKELVSNIRLALLQKANEKNIQLRLLIDHDLPDIVKGDPVRLGQILTNLISNAVKFTNLNGTITIHSKIEDKNVVICVEDTGIGIKETDQQKIFSFTTHTTLGTANEKGTGIGLKICKDFIELNNGKIWMTSVENVGSKFFVSIPL